VAIDRRVPAVLLATIFSVSLCSCVMTGQTQESVQAPGDVDIIVNREREIIEDDGAPWYQASAFELESEYGDPSYNIVVNNIISADESAITTLITGYTYADPSGNINYTLPNEFCHLAKYDYTTGERLLFCDLTSYHCYMEGDGISEDRHCQAALETDDAYYVLYRYEEYYSSAYEYHLLNIDKDTGEVISDTVSTALSEKISSNERIFGSAVGDSQFVLLVGNPTSTTAPDWSGSHMVVYDVLNDVIIDFPVADILGDCGADVISDVRRIDNEHYAIIGSSFESVSSGTVCVLVDIETMETELVDMTEAMSDITDDLSDVDFGQISNTYVNPLFVRGQDYIATFDLDTWKFQKVFDLDRCNVGQNLFEAGAGAAYADADQVVIVKGLNPQRTECVLGVVRIDRLDANPYAGRTLLTASALSRYVSESETEMICSFNDAQDQYYVAIDNSYAPGNADDYWRDYETYIDETSRMTAQLSVDIMAGDGPDIILDGFEYSEFNSDSCLIDLMPYLEGSEIWDDGLYFSHAFELACDGNGSMYQIPTSIMLQGLVYRETADDDAERAGFTYDEYADYVSNECNGYDALSYERDRIDYFVLCFNAMRDEFVNNGQISLDNEEFRALAEYCFDNVNGAVTSDDLLEIINNGGMIPEVSYAYLPFDMLCNGYGVRGVPSSDGRGPSIVAMTSVGVASSCSCVDGAIAFVEYALSEEAQAIVTVEGEALLRSAVTQKYYDLIPIWAARNEMQAAQDPMAAIRTLTTDSVDEGLERYSRYINNASGYTGGDSDISIILYEEMQAYFCGDKTIDDVISIIEDRAQTVLDERG